MKQQLHRSITFWSGLLLIAFICWAWRDSSGVHSIASASRWTLRQAGSVVSIERSNETPNNAPWAGRYPVDPSTSPWDGAYLAEPMFVKRTEDPKLISRFFVATEPGRYVPRRPEAVHLRFLTFGHGRNWAILIPHWLLLLAVALPWTALLLSRARRRKGANPASV